MNNITELFQMRDDLEATKADHMEKQKLYQRSVSDCTKQIQEVDKQIAELKKLNESDISVKITDHAIVRYLERVYGIDVDAFRKEILSDNVERVISFSNGDEFRIEKDRYTLVVKNKTIVTVI